MKKIFSVLLILFAAISTVQAASLKDKPNVAVMAFANKAAVPKEIAINDASLVSEFVIEQLIDANRFKIIEREALAAIANEYSYNMSGLVDPATAVEIGKQKGVSFIIVGSIVGLSTKESGVKVSQGASGGGVNKLSVVANVTARIVDVETGEIILAASGTGESSRTNAELKISAHYYDINADQKISIGSEKFSQVQVRNALYKAVDDLIYNKNYGLLAKMDGKAKRRKV